MGSLLKVFSIVIVALPEISLGQVGEAVGQLSSDRLTELSGLVASRKNASILWVHNDGGAKGEVFAVTAKGELAGRFEVKEKLEDLEDLALGPGPGERDYLYLGDIGDNDLKRSSIRVWRFPEPVVSSVKNPDKKQRIRDVKGLELTYPDGPHDAEALMVEPSTGAIWIVTKENGRSRVYTVSTKAWESGRGELTLETTLSVERVSAGDISADGTVLILRRENRGWRWLRKPGETPSETFNHSWKNVSVWHASQGRNGEALGIDPKGDGYYTISEGADQTIRWFPLHE